MYKAKKLDETQTQTAEVFALKRFSSAVSKNSRSLSQTSSRTQFMNERKALLKLSSPEFNHEHIVTLHDEGSRFLVLELAMVCKTLHDLFDCLLCVWGAGVFAFL